MKIFQLITLFSLLFLSLVAFSQKGKPAPKPAGKTKKPAVKPKPQDTVVVVYDTVAYKSKADSIVAYSKRFIGIKYCYGGETTKGFDCAGFVGFVFRHFQIKLPRTADAQELLGKSVTRKNAQPGDLIFFRGSNKKNKAVGHSGIVVENKNGKLKFISATVNAGIHIDDLDETYWKERFVSVRRIIEDIRDK